MLLLSPSVAGASEPIAVTAPEPDVPAVLRALVVGAEGEAAVGLSALEGGLGLGVERLREVDVGQAAAAADELHGVVPSLCSQTGPAWDCVVCGGLRAPSPDGEYII